MSYLKLNGRSKCDCLASPHQGPPLFLGTLLFGGREWGWPLPRFLLDFQLGGCLKSGAGLPLGALFLCLELGRGGGGVLRTRLAWDLEGGGLSGLWGFVLDPWHGTRAVLWLGWGSCSLCPNMPISPYALWYWGLLWQSFLLWG